MYMYNTYMFISYRIKNKTECAFFYDDNIDGDVDGDGHGGDDDTIFVTRRTLKVSCNRLYYAVIAHSRLHTPPRK